MQKFRPNGKTNQVLALSAIPIQHPPTSIILDSLKDAFRGRCIADDEDDDLKYSVLTWSAPTLQQRILRDRQTVPHAKVEKVCL